MSFAALSSALALSLLLALPAHATSTLPAKVEQQLSRAGIATESVSVWVQGVDTSQSSLHFNTERPMNPASVMKLVTAFAALERLGPAYTWNTRVALSGHLAGGRLEGDLHLIGSGDPLLSYDKLWRLLRRVQASGVREITGDIILDGSALRLPAHDASAFDGLGLRPYNSGPAGLLLHFNTLHLHLQPSAVGQPVQAVPSPPLAGLEVDNRIAATAGACGVWHRDLSARLEPSPAGTRLVLAGNLPASCGARDWSVSPLPPESFAASLVSSLWSESGGLLGGTVRSGTTPPQASTLFEVDSAPLADAVREMNKWSSNLIARQIVATLGTQRIGSLDMMADGAQVIVETLAAAGIPIQGLVIENGSGLSRVERVRADALGDLLITAWNRPWMPEFISALALAGVDGTARRRLAGSPANGRAHIKTGTLDGVRAMAGYVLDYEGRRHAVVMMVNDPRAFNSEAAQDALIEWVWGGAGK